MRVLPSVLLVVVAVGAAPINMNFQVTPALMDFVCSVVQSPEKARKFYLFRDKRLFSRVQRRLGLPAPLLPFPGRQATGGRLCQCLPRRQVPRPTQPRRVHGSN